MTTSNGVLPCKSNLPEAHSDSKSALYSKQKHQNQAGVSIICMILTAYDFTSPISCSARFCQGEYGSIDVVGSPIFLVNFLNAPLVKLG